MRRDPRERRGPGKGLEAEALKRCSKYPISWLLVDTSNVFLGFSWKRSWGALRTLDPEPRRDQLAMQQPEPPSPRDKVGRAGGQEVALATRILWEVDRPPPTGVPVSEPPPLLPQGTLTPTIPIHLHPLQDGLNQAAGQMDKRDAKVGAGPDASRRPGQELQGSWGTRAHGQPRRPGNMVPMCAGAQRALPMSIVPWALTGQITALYPGNA